MKQPGSARFTIHWLWPVIVAVLLVGAACSNERDTVSDRDQGSRTTAATIRDLSSIEELQEQFNRDEGVTRLILLISPT